MWAADLHGRCVFINREACRMLGYSREECIGQDMHEMVHGRRPDGSAYPRHECPMSMVLRTGSGILVEDDLFWRRDGTSLTVGYSAQPVVIQERVEGVMATIWETARRRRAEESLRASEARVRTVFDNALIGMAVVSLDGRFLQVNQSLCRITGYAEQELLQTDFASVTHPDDREDGLELKRAMIAGETSQGVMTKRYVRRDGKPVWVCVNISVVRDGNGQPLHFATLVEDISERKKAEEVRHNFELLSEHSRDPILYLRRGDRRLLETNAAAARAYGYTRDELLQLSIYDLHGPGMPVLTDDQLAEADAHGILFEAVHRRKGGSTFPVEVSARGTTISGTRVLFSVIRDITERKRAEEERRKSEEWLEFAHRAAGIGICYKDSAETRVSAEQFRLYGLAPRPNWLTREEWLQMVHPEDRERVAFEQSLALEQQRPYQMRFRVVWPDGSVHWLFCNGRTFPGEREGLTRKIEVTVDTTDRMQAESALQQFFTVSDSPLAVIGFDGYIRRGNPALLKATGYTIEEMQSRPFTEFLHPDDAPAMAAQFASICAFGGSTQGELRGLRKDGSQLWLLFSSTASKDEQLVYTAAHDITEHKWAEAALAEEASRRRVLFEESKDGIVVVDARGKVVEANPSFARTLGYSLEELLQLCVWDWQADMTRDQILEELRDRQSQPRTFETHHRRKDGTLVDVEVSLTQILLGAELFQYAVVRDIKDRKRVEAALAEEVRQRRVLFEQSKDGIVVRDASGKVLEANQSFARMLGYSVEETQQLHVWDWEPSLTRDLIPEKNRTIRNAPATFERRLRRKDGSWLDVETSMSAVDLGGRVLYYSVVRDTTDRKRVEAALVEEVSRRRVLFEQSKDGIIVFDRSGKTIESNQSFARMLGYSVEELHDLHVWDYDDHMTRDQILEAMATIQSVPTTFETCHRRKDGNLVDVEVSSTAIELGADTVYYAVVRDITDRKRAQEALRVSEQRFKLIAQAVDEAFWITDPAIERMIYISPAYERIWERSLESLYEDPRSFLSPVHPDDLGPTLAHLERMKSALPLDHEYRLIRPDGSLMWIWNRGFPVRGAAGEVEFYVGAVKDITERKRMEEALKQDAEKLARSNAELERFAYVASHDLQEPLRMVASYTQLLAKRYAGQLDERADRYIHYAVDGATRMQQLIVDLLAYSRVNSKALDLRLTDCELAVAGSLQNLKTAIEESGASVTCDPLPTFMADTTQLVQLFQNLLGNAIKFRRELPPHVHISAVDKGAEWLFSIRDNGIGIDQKHADSIFQVFQRLHGKGEYPGTGIGLALCKTVVERHGGKIWVESEVGVGSDFRFTLPKRNQNGDNLEGPQ